MLPVLVTAGAGIIGSAEVEALLERGLHVIAFDVNLQQGRLSTHEHLERVEGDIRDRTLVDNLVARSSRVFHLAAIAGVHEYMSRPLDVIDINFEGSRNVFDAATRHGRPVLFSSTSEAYGKNSSVLDETSDTVLGPATRRRWCYSTSKLLSEHYGYGLTDQGLSLVVVRYFNVYGPRLDAPGTGRVLSQFLGALQDGRPLNLVDGGHAVRCFCYIEDAVRATVHLGLHIGPDTPWRGTPFNIGDPVPYTMKELAEHVLRLSGSPVGTVNVPGERFFGAGFEEIQSRTPDITKLTEAIGFQPEWDLDRGLRATLAHWGLLAEHPSPPRLPLIPAIKPVFDADQALNYRVRAILDSGWATNGGPYVTELEQSAGQALGRELTAAVGSGAAGLLVAGKAMGLVGKIILPSWTYIATLNAVELLGCEPVLCDVDRDTWVMTPSTLTATLSRHPEAVGIIPVNTFGVHVDLPGLRDVAGARKILYDNAHGFGSRWDHHPLPPGADATVMSLHATKILPATEGGLVTSTNAQLMEQVRALRAHGLGDHPEDAQVGWNAKMDEIAAAIALHGLKRFHQVLRRRRQYAEQIRGALREAGWRPQQIPERCSTNVQNIGVIVPMPRARAIDEFARHGVEARSYFHPPLHKLRRLAGREQSPLPHTERLYHGHICLPVHSRMTGRQLQRITHAIQCVASGG